MCTLELWCSQRSSSPFTVWYAALYTITGNSSKWSLYAHYKVLFPVYVSKLVNAWHFGRKLKWQILVNYIFSVRHLGVPYASVSYKTQMSYTINTCVSVAL